jgi:putative Mg2+ transporter-C (MgtC) family protein
MSLGGAGPLLLAFVLSSLIGLERELHQKTAGLRTHTLVGTGSALFMLVGMEAFGDSRIGAQVVTGIGFIGAGVIFLRRDGVKGLTTAATIWLTSAVGLAAGAGLAVIALVATGLHLLTTFGYTQVVRRLPPSRFSTHSVEVRYRDGEGILRSAMASTTQIGYLVSDVEVARQPGDGRSVRVRFDVEGRQPVDELVQRLQGIDGVLEVRVGDLSA